MKMIFALIVLDDVLVQLHVSVVVVVVHSFVRHWMNHWIFFEKLYHYVEMLDVMEMVIDLKMNLLMVNEV